MLISKDEALARDESRMARHAKLAQLTRKVEAARGDDPGTVRARIVPELRTVLDEGRAAAERQLIEDGNGLACAQRLSGLMDDVVRTIYEAIVRDLYPAENPSTGERLAVI